MRSEYNQKSDKDILFFERTEHFIYVNFLIYLLRNISRNTNKIPIDFDDIKFENNNTWL